MGQPEEKREKMDEYGLKTGGGVGQPKEKKEKTKGLVGTKNRGRGAPT